MTPFADSDIRIANKLNKKMSLFDNMEVLDKSVLAKNRKLRKQIDAQNAKMAVLAASGIKLSKKETQQRKREARKAVRICPFFIHMFDLLSFVSK